MKWIFLILSDFESELFYSVKIWIENLPTCQILNRKFVNMSDLKQKFFISSNVKIWPSSTTHVFLNVFFHSTKNNYSLQSHRRLDISICRSNKSCCTNFHMDFGFWFRCCVSLFFLYELDICKNNLLLLGLMIEKLEAFLIHKCLSSFWKMFW